MDLERFSALLVPSRLFEEINERGDTYSLALSCHLLMDTPCELSHAMPLAEEWLSDDR